MNDIQPLITNFISKTYKKVWSELTDQVRTKLFLGEFTLGKFRKDWCIVEWVEYADYSRVNLKLCRVNEVDQIQEVKGRSYSIYHGPEVPITELEAILWG